jgi:peptidoglycan/xylan/chitin deacetylase (PgdA/CDA1 family)
MTAASALKAWIRSRLLRPWVVCAVPGAKGQIALTFDDGPHPEHTRTVMAALEAHGARATFFCVGSQLAKEAELVAEMKARGHEIANHSMTHAEFAQIGYERICSELDDVFTMRDAAGTSVAAQGYFRPPKGVINAAVLRYCAARGKRIIHWNRDPKDFATQGVEEVMVGLGAQPLTEGDIVLLHDKMPHSAASVEKILQRLEESRLKAVTVSTLLAAASL